MRLTDFGKACSWKIRYGGDVVRDGQKKPAPWSASYYHLSENNNTALADCSVDQFSMAMLIILVLMGRSHTVFYYASKYRQVHFTVQWGGGGHIFLRSPLLNLHSIYLGFHLY